MPTSSATVICTEPTYRRFQSGSKMRVAKPQGVDVLHGLLAEVMVDAINLALVEHGRDIAVERAGTLEIVAKRLFDDDPAPG